ncbi:MAG: hypothetical protein ABI615_13710, partial [Chthoniobacterales bacterium]
TGLRVAAALFGLSFLVHVVRLMTHFPVIIGTITMPMWASVIGLIIAGSLCLWMWHLSYSVSRTH